MPYPPLSLVKRLALGVPLTPAQEDQNKTDIETGVNAQLAQLAVALNPNGTLKPGSVSTAALQDRVVTQAKLDFQALFYAVDTGAANAMVISFAPPFTAYASGDIFWVKAAATNTGATTINANSAGVKSVKTFTGGTLSELGPGQIIIGNIYEMVYDGVQFLVLNPSTSTAVSGPVFVVPTAVYSGGAIAFTDYDASAIIPSGAKAAKLQVQARWSSATDGESVVSVRADGLSQSYLVGRVGGTDAVVMGCQAEVPVTVGRHFEYRATETVPGAALIAIDVIGYIA